MADISREDVAERATEYAGRARRKVMDLADERKPELVSTLDRLARDLRDAGDNQEGPPRKVLNTASRYVRQARDALDSKSSDELVDSALSELRTRPWVMAAGLFALGFAGVRVVRELGTRGA